MKLPDIPTAEQVREVQCPKCGAKPGEPCHGQRENRNHRDRVTARRKT